MENIRVKMQIGKIYKRIDGKRFPFDCPYGVFVEVLKQDDEFLRFVWDGKDMLLNGGEFEEVLFSAGG